MTNTPTQAVEAAVQRLKPLVEQYASAVAGGQAGHESARKAVPERLAAFETALRAELTRPQEVAAPVGDEPTRCGNCGKPYVEGDNYITEGDPEGEFFCSVECREQHDELGCPHEHNNGYRHPTESKRLINCENALRSLASWLSAGGYNAPQVDAKVFEEKIRWGVDHLLAASRVPVASPEPGSSLAEPRLTVQYHKMPELPPYPSNISHVTRRIRACEGETAAQIVLEYAMREYASAAIAEVQQKLDDMTADYLRRHREVCELKFGRAAVEQAAVAVPGDRREAFEQHLTRNVSGLGTFLEATAKYENGDYVSKFSQQHWLTWQAAAPTSPVQPDSGGLGAKTSDHLAACDGGGTA